MSLTLTTRGTSASATSGTHDPDAGREATAAIVIPVTLVLVNSRRGDLATALPWDTR